MPKMDPKRLLSVGEAAQRADVPVSTLHFYESRGLITAVRNKGNQRRFPREVLRRIAVIRIAQRIGISLSEIAEQLNALPDGRTPSAKDWTLFATRWKDQLDERIRLLLKLRDQLGDCIGCGCLSVKDCALRNPDDVLAK